MRIKSKLSKKSAYISDTISFYTHKEISELPIIVEKSKRNKKKLVLRIPVEIDVKRFLDDDLKLYADILNDSDFEKFKLLDTEPRPENEAVKRKIRSILEKNPESAISRYEDRIENKNENIRNVMLGKNLLKTNKNSQSSVKNSKLGTGKKLGSKNKNQIVDSDELTLKSNSSLNSKNTVTDSVINKALQNRDRTIIANSAIFDSRDNLIDKQINNSLVVEKTYIINFKRAIKKKSLSHYNKKKSEVNNSRRVKKGLSVRSRERKIKNFPRKTNRKVKKVNFFKRSKAKITAESTRSTRMPARKKYTNRSIFGTKKVVSLKKIDPRKTKGTKPKDLPRDNVINMPPARAKLGNSKSKAVVNSRKRSIKSLINRSYRNLKDPSESFVGYNTHKNIKNSKKSKISRVKINGNKAGRKNNVGFRLNSRRGNKIKRKTQRTIDIRNKVFAPALIKTDSKSGSPKAQTIELQRKSKKFSYPVLKEVLTTYKIAFLEVDYSEASNFKFGSNFIRIRYRVTNSTGINIAQKFVDVDLQKAYKNYILDTFEFPTFSVKSNKRLATANLIISNPSKSGNITCNVFKKSIGELKTDIDSNFEPIENENSMTVGAKSRKKFTVQSPGQQKALFRMTYTLQNEKLNNFSTYQIENRETKTRSNSRTKIVGRISKKNISNSFERVKKGRIDISIANIPDDVKEVKLLRRNVANKRKLSKFKEVINTPEDKAKNFKSKVSIDVKTDVKKDDTELTKGLFDNNVKDGQEFEYKVQFIDKKGQKKESKHVFRQRYKKPKNRVKASLKRDRKKSKMKNSFSVFKLDLKRDGKSEIENQIDNFVKTLGDQEKKSFEKDINDLKSNLTQPLTAKVEVFNTTKGESEELGEFKAGDEIKLEKKFDHGTHKLIVKPLEKNAEDEFDKIKESLKKIETVVASNVSIASPQTKTNLANLKDQINKVTTTKGKFYTPEYLNTGKIVTPEALSDKLGKDITLQQETNDIIEVDIVKTIRKEFDIIKSDIAITPLHRILLSFNISKKIDLFNIDFLIISAEKEGNEYPVGTAHVDNADYNIKFLDITNEDFYGRINYFVKPVFEDAEIGNRVYLGTVNLLTKIHIID